MTPRQIQQLRHSLGESTATFGARFCRSGRTVEEWEQGRRIPSRVAIAAVKKLRAECRTPAKKNASVARKSC
jgi:DNA-binding transcriptional regulator YiaG